MPEAKPLTRKEIADEFAGDPLLADFLAVPKRLDRGKADLATTFERMAAAVGKGARAALIRFAIRDGRTTRVWSLVMTADGCKVSEAKYARSDLEILTDAATWSSIAGGELSPLEAFGRGKLRVRGDIALARHVARKLQGA